MKNSQAAIVAPALIVFVGMTLFSMHASAADGTISIAGKVKANTCTVDLSTSEVILVTLPDVKMSTFTSVNTVSSESKEFKIRLVDCGDAVSSAQVQFDGTHATDATILSVDSASVAQGVGIRFTDINGKTIALGTPTDAYALTPSIENDLTFKANYISTVEQKSIVPGDLIASATFTLTYQ